MSSRDEILRRLQDVGSRMSDVGSETADERTPSNTQHQKPDIKHQKSDIHLPTFNTSYIGDPITKFKELIEILHGEVIEVAGAEEIREFITGHYGGQRVLTSTTLSDLNNSEDWKTADPHSLENVEFTLVEGTLGVAENGAIWLTEEQLSQRVAPFINQQLGVVINKNSIVSTMAQAYEKLGDPNSGFGIFIAGPSKTADIEQSLVTGAHGARGLVVFMR